MRSLIMLLLAGTAVWALPSPYSHLPARAPLSSANTLTLTQLSNTTSPLTNEWPIICYQDYEFLRANRDSCDHLIIYLASQRDFGIPKRWSPGLSEPEWFLEGCKISIASGKYVSEFSMRDVVSQVLRVLEVCQPPKYFGIGGSAPVRGQTGFMYAAFHVQVTGIKS